MTAHAAIWQFERDQSDRGISPSASLNYVIERNRPSPLPQRRKSRAILGDGAKQISRRHGRLSKGFVQSFKITLGIVHRALILI